MYTYMCTECPMPAHNSTASVDEAFYTIRVYLRDLEDQNNAQNFAILLIIASILLYLVVCVLKHSCRASDEQGRMHNVPSSTNICADDHCVLDGIETTSTTKHATDPPTGTTFNKIDDATVDDQLHANPIRSDSQNPFSTESRGDP